MAGARNEIASLASYMNSVSADFLQHTFDAHMNVETLSIPVEKILVIDSGKRSFEERLECLDICISVLNCLSFHFDCEVEKAAQYKFRIEFLKYVTTFWSKSTNQELSL
jgi:hypothetical protein